MDSNACKIYDNIVKLLEAYQNVEKIITPFPVRLDNLGYDLEIEIDPVQETIYIIERSEDSPIHVKESYIDDFIEFYYLNQAKDHLDKKK